MCINKKVFSLLIISLAFTGTGCGWFGSTPASTPSEQPASESATTTAPADDAMAQDTALSNPATVYCLRQNGKFTMKKMLNGSMEGYCTLPNNITCEEWAYYRGECPAEAKDKNKDQNVTTTDETNKPAEPDVKTQEPTSTSTSPDQKDTNTDNQAQPAFKQTAPTELPNTFSSSADQTGLQASTAPGSDLGELTLKWKTNGLDSPDGFIVMLSGNQDISYPTKYAHALSNPNSRAFTWVDLTPDKTYYFRVCIAEGDSCKTYSSVVSGLAATTTQE